VYYPGAADISSASPVEVGGAEPAEGIDLTLHPGKVAHIRGQVMNPADNLTVGLLHSDENGSGSSTSTQPVNDTKGKFELENVAPGSYTLIAQATVGSQRYAAHLPIQVGTADLEGIELHLVPPIEIAGQIRIEGKTDAKMSQLNVMLEDERHVNYYFVVTSAVKEDGSFSMQGLIPAVYHVTASPPGDLYLKAARWSDRDMLESGLDLAAGAGGSGLVVVLSANGGKIDGVVEDDRGVPAELAQVLLMPVDAQRRKALLKLTMTDRAGRFSMRAIAPGSYKLYAFDDDADTNQVMYDPDFVKPFASRAESVEISEGSHKNLQLNLIMTADQPGQ